MKIGIIAAMPEEAGAIVRCASSLVKEIIGNRTCYRFLHGKHAVLVMQAGMGFDNAARSAETIIDSFAPDLLLSAGFCGGIAPELQVGDTVVASGFVIASGATVQQVPIELPAFTRKPVKELTDHGKRAFESLFVSTPTVMNKAAIAKLLPDQASFPVVEMESAAIALIAVENKIPFLAIRTVSDPRNEELQFSIEEFCDAQLNISIPKVLLTLFKRPQILPQLLRLARYSRTAGLSLGTSVEILLSTIRYTESI